MRFPILQTLEAAVVLFALCVLVGNIGRNAAQGHPHKALAHFDLQGQVSHWNPITFLAATLSKEQYQESLGGPWVARIASVYLPSKILGPQPEWDRYKAFVGKWTAFWFLVSCCAFVGMKGSLGAWMLMATAVAWAYCPGIVDIRICSWDMPAMASFAWASRLWLSGKFWSMAATLVPMFLFKETAIVFVLCALFREGKWWHRLAVCVIIGVMLLALRVGISYLTTGSMWAPQTMTGFSGKPLILENTLLLFVPMFNSVWLANAGTLLLVFAGKYTQRTGALWCVAGTFLAMLFAFGMVNEQRIFLELAPLAAFGLIRRTQ